MPTMSIFENLEDYFQDWRSYNDCTKSLLTLSTAIGGIIILYYFFRLVCKSFLGLRLYVCSQMCCRGDLVKKYGEWAVISGSTDGIGLAMAKDLAKRGHSILVIARNEEKLAKTKEMLQRIENVGQVETVKIDLSDSSVENFERIRAQIDPDNRNIAILINNAGTFQSKFKRFDTNSMEELRTIVNVNLLATVYLTRMILPAMLKRQGAQRSLIVNVSSIMGNAYEYSGEKIDIVCLTPGPVYTKLFEQTNTLKNPTLFSPTADDYAKSAINCFGTGINKMSGTLLHGLMSEYNIFIKSVGLMPLTLYLGSLVYPNTVDLGNKKKKVGPSEANTQAGEQENVFNASHET